MQDNLEQIFHKYVNKREPKHRDPIRRAFNQLDAKASCGELSLTNYTIAHNEIIGHLMRNYEPDWHNNWMRK